LQEQVGEYEEEVMSLQNQLYQARQREEKDET
jgi:hypothetical protein